MLHEKGFWTPYDSGQSIGTIGTENGTILMDDQHDFGARITLEKGGYQPFIITCGVYGFGFTTTFALKEPEAISLYERMKTDLDICLNAIQPDSVSQEEAWDMLVKFMDMYN